MPYALETLMTRLEKKNAAIAKKAATTKKHAQRYLKNRSKKSAEEMKYDYSYSDMKNSAADLKWLFVEKREILRLIDEANKNQIRLPEILKTYQMDLEKSFIADRTWRRNWLQTQWEECYQPLIKACSNDIWNKFTNFKYRHCFTCSYPHYTHVLKKDAVIDPEDEADLAVFLAHEKASTWNSANREKRTESDESIAKRSASDAKKLVEDLYTRTFGWTGEVTDYSGLNISQDNNGFAIINGIIRGVNGACKVESIGAGGYNIQCWHIRVLVKPAK